MSVPLVIQLGAAGLVGFLCWGFVEYVIHGFLSHRFRTPVSPMHWGHHESPRNVFTTPIAWVPIALLFLAGTAALVGWALASGFVGGLLLGFARYEWIHWRLHFREPRNARERLLRNHHLAHHFRDPGSYHGVTTRFWDRVFGTLPEHRDEDYAAVADVPVVSGASNLRDGWNPRLAWARVRALREHPRR